MTGAHRQSQGCSVYFGAHALAPSRAATLARLGWWCYALNLPPPSPLSLSLFSELSLARTGALQMTVILRSDKWRCIIHTYIYAGVWRNWYTVSIITGSGNYRLCQFKKKLTATFTVPGLIRRCLVRKFEDFKYCWLYSKYFVTTVWLVLFLLSSFGALWIAEVYSVGPFTPPPPLTIEPSLKKAYRAAQAFLVPLRHDALSLNFSHHGISIWDSDFVIFSYNRYGFSYYEKSNWFVWLVFCRCFNLLYQAVCGGGGGEGVGSIGCVYAVEPVVILIVLPCCVCARLLGLLPLPPLPQQCTLTSGEAAKNPPYI